MGKYKVKILSRAYKNIEEIYGYIANELLAPEAALNLVGKLEETILSLEIMPRRFPTRKTGSYANKGYRQVFVGNFTIIYRIDDVKKVVTVVVVKYSKSNF